MPSTGPGDAAYLVLSRVRTGLAERLDADDLAALDALLADDAPGSLLRRHDLVVRSSRTAWCTHAEDDEHMVSTKTDGPVNP